MKKMVMMKNNSAEKPLGSTERSGVRCECCTYYDSFSKKRYTVTTKQNGDRVIDFGESVIELYANGEATMTTKTTISLEKNLLGTWKVGLDLDLGLLDLVSNLRDGLGSNRDLSGDLTQVLSDDYFLDVSPYSEELTDEEVKKVREFFTPDFLDMAK